jgi:hypothetical protein
MTTFRGGFLMERRINMKKVVKKEVKEEMHGFYKGYEIKWLRNEPQHPDFKLVAEYDKLGTK